jgi:hypothetical protein
MMGERKPYHLTTLSTRGGQIESLTWCELGIMSGKYGKVE